MGEAKRRRDRLGQPRPYVDALTGEAGIALNAGDVEAFVNGLIKMAEERLAGGRPIASVPCGTCSACCYFKIVDFDPRLEPSANLARLRYVQDEDKEGWARLEKRSDGACVHLGEKGCSVYEHRPAPCREFDCRTSSLVGMSQVFDAGQVSPAWLFESHTVLGHMLRHALHIMGLSYMGRMCKAGTEATVQGALTDILPRLGELRAALEPLSKLTPAQRAAALGVSLQAPPSEAEMTAMMRRIALG